MDLFNIRTQLNSGKSIYDIPLRVTYYARVSTDKDEQLHSLNAQVDYYSEFIKNNPNWTFVDGYIDEGLSGTSVNKREAFLRMIDDAKADRFDFIVTKEISRFSRNTIDSIKYTQDLLACGVGVLFQSDNINTLYPDSELRLTIMSSIAQDEVRRISERVRFGFKRSIEKGVVLGNNSLLGYDKAYGKLTIVEEDAAIVRLIFDLYANENKGFRLISRRLSELGYTNSKGNAFSASSLKDTILNPKYKGFYCGNKSHKYDYRRPERKIHDPSEWVMYQDHDTVPPIVSEELWDKANSIFHKRSAKQRSEDRSSYQNKYPYSGKIICMEHRTAYHHAVFKGSKIAKEVWRCKLVKEKGNSACTNPTVYTSEIDEILRNVMTVVFREESRRKIVDELTELYASICDTATFKTKKAEFEKQITVLQKKKSKLLDLSVNERISDEEFSVRNDEFNAEITALKMQIAECDKHEEHNSNSLTNMQNLRKIINKRLSFDEAMGSGVVSNLLERIEVYGTGNRNSLKLKVVLKISDDALDYEISRKRGNDSVITAVCDSHTTSSAH